MGKSSCVFNIDVFTLQLSRIYKVDFKSFKFSDCTIAFNSGVFAVSSPQSRRHRLAFFCTNLGTCFVGQLGS